MKTKHLKMILYVIIGLVALILIYFITIFSIAYFTDYKPQLQEELEISKSSNLPEIVDNQDEFSILIWNIGYCGLGKDDDFFYDGGKNTMPTTENYQKNLNNVYKVLEQNKYVDFILLQEVDRDAKRSFKQDELDLFSTLLDNHYHSFAKTYDVSFVPVPILKPMGKVVSGMVTFSNRKPYKATRNAFDVNFSWWKRIFMLDRCFIASHFKIGEKDLVIINIHNSAFDSENKLKPIELQTIKTYAAKEYEKGNYVVIGGDWNQNPPGFNQNKYDKTWNMVAIDQPIPNTMFSSDWTWVFPNAEPTQRFVDMPFEKGKTKTTIIDAFVISPNIESLSLRVLVNDFTSSDHNPLLMNFKFKADSLNAEILTDSVVTVNE